MSFVIQRTSENPEYYKKLFSLEDKVAIVTGAVGHLGSAISKALASYGARTILIGRTEKNLVDFVEKNNKNFNNKFVHYACDVTNDKEFKKIVSAVVKNYNRVDILVNNAFNEKRKEIDKITKADWNKGMENILTHQFTCSQAILPTMLEQGKGSIINIASVYGFLGIDQRSYTEVASSTPFYATAKAGVIELTKYLATCYGSKGIKTNSISPGFFPKPPKEENKARPGYIVSLSSRVPMQRIGCPDEVAGAVIFLASDASSFVNGHNLVIDGGFSCW